MLAMVIGKTHQTGQVVKQTLKKGVAEYEILDIRQIDEVSRPHFTVSREAVFNIYKIKFPNNFKI